MAKKKEFGKGLRALLTNIESTTQSEATEASTRSSPSSIATIAIDAIEANPHQPRKDFDLETLEALATSIRTYGLIQPVTVRAVGNGKFQLIAGERRFRAAQLAGLRKLPAYIRTADDQGMLEMALIENIQRSDLNALEIAVSYKRLLDECALTHAELSERIGKKRSTITNYVRLLKLPVPIQEAIKSQAISMGHARALLGLEEADIQLDIFKEVLAKKLSVRDTERMIQRMQNGTSERVDRPSQSHKHPEIKRMEDRLSDLWGTHVRVHRDKKGKGRIQIDFGSDDELNRLIDLLDS